MSVTSSNESMRMVRKRALRNRNEKTISEMNILKWYNMHNKPIRLMSPDRVMQNIWMQPLEKRIAGLLHESSFFCSVCGVFGLSNLALKN